jgi:hypothetical protein
MLRSVSRRSLAGESGVGRLSGLLSCVGLVKGDGDLDRYPSGLPGSSKGECGGVTAAGRLGVGIGRAWGVVILPVTRVRASSIPKS